MDPLRFAFIGTGNITRRHFKELLAHDDACIVALCDPAPGATEQRAKDSLPEGYPAVAHYSDAGAMLVAEDIDCVVIASPHTLHFEHAMAAIASDCHVFLEKPMVTKVADAYALRDAAKAANKVVAIGYNTPCRPSFAYLRDAIRDQRFGKLELVSGYLAQNWLLSQAGTWRQRLDLSGGGQAYDSGAHLLNSLLWAVESPVAAVAAFIDEHGTEVDINSSISIRFENGVLASMAVGGNCMTAGSHTSFMFTDGRIDIDGWTGNWLKVFTKAGEVEPELVDQDPRATHNFIAAVRGSAEALTNPMHGILQSELMEAIYASARDKLIVEPKRVAATAG